MAILFNQPVKHGAVQLLPGVPLGFADPDAEPYFIKAGWASSTVDSPAFVYDAEVVSVDPETVFADGANKGRRVLGEGE